MIYAQQMQTSIKQFVGAVNNTRAHFLSQSGGSLVKNGSAAPRVVVINCKNIVASIYFTLFLCLCMYVYVNISFLPGIHISFGNPLAGQLVLFLNPIDLVRQMLTFLLTNQPTFQCKWLEFKLNRYYYSQQCDKGYKNIMTKLYKY